MWLAIGGVVTAVVTTLGAVATARIQGRREKEKSAEIAADDILRRRLEVKDERIALRDEQLADCHRRNADLEAENQRLRGIRG